MGAGYHGGFGKTYGNSTHKDNGTSYISQKNLINENIVFEMQKNRIKFTKENLVFVARDKTGQIVFLEKGKDDAGLKHIQNRHAMEFFEAFGVKSGNIPHYLYKVVTNGNIADNHIEIRNGRKTVTRVYDCQGNYYILTGIGTNGFIVTARPARKE